MRGSTVHSCILMESKGTAAGQHVSSAASLGLSTLPCLRFVECGATELCADSEPLLPSVPDTGCVTLYWTCASPGALH